jgi:1-acyl-sn-glycerol-3-phosphate acyltransferase
MKTLNAVMPARLKPPDGELNRRVRIGAIVTAEGERTRVEDSSAPFPLTPALSPREREEASSGAERMDGTRGIGSHASLAGNRAGSEPTTLPKPAPGADETSSRANARQGGRSRHPLPKGEGRGEGERGFRSSTSITASGEPISTPDPASRICPELPVNSRWFTRFFAAYSDRLVRKHFHAVRFLGAPDLATFAGRPLVIYANHPSWWDPLIALVVWRRLLGDRIPYAPIDAAMLQKYAFFKRLGFFGVDKQSLVGARRFLRVGRELLARPDTLLLITPQGRFADVRDATAGFEPGLAHLARAVPEAVYLPLAMEITFWEEKRPEALLRFGEPVFPCAGPRHATRESRQDHLGVRWQSAAATPLWTDPESGVALRFPPQSICGCVSPNGQSTSKEGDAADEVGLHKPKAPRRGAPNSVAELNRQLEDALREASTRLAEASVRREVEAFQNLLSGGAGTQPVYDAWRWLKATARGQTFNPAHGDK